MNASRPSPFFFFFVDYYCECKRKVKMGRPWEQNYQVNSLKLFVIVDTRLFMPLLPHVENFRYMKFSIKDVGMACQKVHKQEREDIYKSESKCINSCPFLRLFTTEWKYKNKLWNICWMAILLQYRDSYHSTVHNHHIRLALLTKPCETITLQCTYAEL